MRPILSLFLIFFLLSANISGTAINTQNSEVLEVYSVKGDTLRPLKNNSLAFQRILIKFVTFLNQSFIYVNCTFSNNSVLAFNKSVSMGYYTYSIKAPINITKLLIVTKTLRILYVNIITKLTKSYEEIYEENQEYQRRIFTIVFTLEQYQALILSAIIYAAAGAGIGVIYAYSRARSIDFGVEVLAGGYRKLEKEVSAGEEHSESSE